MAKEYIFSTYITQILLNQYYLKCKPAIMPKQLYTLPAVFHIAFVELRWRAASLQGQLNNCHLFEGGPSITRRLIDSLWHSSLAGDVIPLLQPDGSLHCVWLWLAILTSRALIATACPQWEKNNVSRAISSASANSSQAAFACEMPRLRQVMLGVPTKREATQQGDVRVYSLNDSHSWRYWEKLVKCEASQEDGGSRGLYVPTAPWKGTNMIIADASVALLSWHRWSVN